MFEDKLRSVVSARERAKETLRGFSDKALILKKQELIKLFNENKDLREKKFIMKSCAAITVLAGIGIVVAAPILSAGVGIIKGISFFGGLAVGALAGKVLYSTHKKEKEHLKQMMHIDELLEMVEEEIEQRQREKEIFSDIFNKEQEN